MPRWRLFREWWTAFGRLAGRRALMIASCSVLTFLACFTGNLIRGHDPLPSVHDEYAYLLAGDTFAQGRLTNPPHELWRSLETFHELQKPTRQAKYPPGQGLVLALGTLISGRAIVGVWIGAAAFVAALCWMMQGWFPARWAVVGTVIGAAAMVFAGRPLYGAVLGYWSQSYWGGAVAATGGALVLGALPRVVRGASWRAALLLGLGASVLALTRPFEGLVVVLCAGGVVAGWLFVSGRLALSGKLRRVVLPSACVVAAGVGWLGLYNQSVTESPLRLPYMAYREQYQIMPIWSWQEVRPEPEGLNRQMSEYARWELEEGRVQSRFWRRLVDSYKLVCFEAGPLLAPLMLILIPWTVWSRWMLFAGGAWLVTMGAQWTGTYFEAHYHAPAAPLTVILVTAALRRLALARGKLAPVGPPLAGLLVGCTLLLMGVRLASYAAQGPTIAEHWAETRQSVIDELTRSGGKHVVFLRYGPAHWSHIELVFNRADIDGTPVVWVRELDEAQNAKVLEYYQDRKPWLMVIDDDRARARIGPWPTKPHSEPHPPPPQPASPNGPG